MSESITCQICGCTSARACLDAGGQACSWTFDDDGQNRRICSACDFLLLELVELADERPLSGPELIQALADEGALDHWPEGVGRERAGAALLYLVIAGAFGSPPPVSRPALRAALMERVLTVDLPTQPDRPALEMPEPQLLGIEIPFPSGSREGT